MGKLQKLQVGIDNSAQNCVALDVDFLNRNTFGDIALRTEIINLFRAQLDAVRTQLLLPVDLKNWTYLTHTLRGAAAAVGAAQLVDLADAWTARPAPTGQSARLNCEFQLKLALVHFNRAVDTLTD